MSHRRYFGPNDADALWALRGSWRRGFLRGVRRKRWRRGPCKATGEGRRMTDAPDNPAVDAGAGGSSVRGSAKIGRAPLPATCHAEQNSEGGLAVVVSPSLRQSGFLFRKLTRHLVASDAGLSARDAHGGRAGLGRLGGEPAGRSSRDAARPVAAPRRSGGADRRRGEPCPGRDVGDDLADARGGTGGAADPALDAGRRQR